MNSLKPIQLAGIVLCLLLALYILYTHLAYFGNVSFLGGILGLEIIIAALWKFERRFLVLLIVTFVWAGTNVPLAGAGTAGRWVILATAALAGLVVWLGSPRAPFRTIHLVAFFCVCSAFASATVSPFLQMAMLKSLSLLLLFLYCSAGARLGVLGREERFFPGLILGCEIAVYITAVCYFGLGRNLWGNPNSLGAAMSVGAFPILLWGWFTSDVGAIRYRRLVALLLSAYLVRFSLARAGLAALALVAILFFVCLRQYRSLVKGVALVLVVVAISGMLAPDSLSQQLGAMEDAILYKGHKDEGVLGSRKEPWDKTVASIKEHPWFGTGYGTSPTGEDPGELGPFRSTHETAREHGSSYITILEWEGLLGVWPFVVLLGMAVLNVRKVCVWMRRTCDPFNYSIPMAMVVVAGLAHATFEDSIFAVGSYLCLFFWIFVFLLADYVPGAADVPLPSMVRPSRYAPAGFGAVVPNR